MKNDAFVNTNFNKNVANVSFVTTAHSLIRGVPIGYWYQSDFSKKLSIKLYWPASKISNTSTNTSSPSQTLLHPDPTRRATVITTTACATVRQSIKE